jgi:hypothetical protein
VIRIFNHIAQEHRRRIHNVENDVDVPVIEQIAEGRAAGRNYICQSTIGRGRNFIKLGSIHVMK